MKHPILSTAGFAATAVFTVSLLSGLSASGQEPSATPSEAEQAALRLRKAVEALETQLQSASQRLTQKIEQENALKVEQAKRKVVEKSLQNAVGAIDVLMNRLADTEAERDNAVSSVETLLNQAVQGKRVQNAEARETANAETQDQGEAKLPVGELDLFEKGVEHWKVLEDFPANGGIEATEEAGIFRVKAGDPLSGIRYEGPYDLPVTNYEISFDARRVKGNDFFCGLTFPVNSVKTCCTFVAGGWGGALAGISSLDGMDAANNDTSTFHKFEEGKWHAFRIQVTPATLKVWMDDKIITDVELETRKVSMRWGDIEYCVPFGLATYQTAGEFRKFHVSRLDKEPIPLKKADK